MDVTPIIILGLSSVETSIGYDGTQRLERMPVPRSQGCISDVSMQTDDCADQGRLDNVNTRRDQIL